MADRSSIEWTDATWNPVTGCTKVSPGCDNCYAETLTERFRGTPGHYFEQGFDVQLRADKLDLPLRWRKPRKVFVNSTSDLFHDSVPTEFIVDVFATMMLAPRHTFQVLTKRPARMRHLLTADNVPNTRYPMLKCTFLDLVLDSIGRRFRMDDWWDAPNWPLPNVWLGVSTEDQKWADIRIPQLLDTPAAVRFISAEPLLGSIDLHRYAWNEPSGLDGDWTRGLDWVIVGGESGRYARPMHPNWVREIRDHCITEGVAFHFKQWGEWAVDGYTDENGHHANIPRDAKDPKRLVIHPAGMTAMHPGNPFNPFERGHPNWANAMRRVGKKVAGRELDGRTWDQEPQEATLGN